MNDYYVYMMTNQSRCVLYTGITNNLGRRVYEHKTKSVQGFTARYNVTKLVYFQSCTDVKDAIAYEKKIKGWTRNKKDKIIESMNPNWIDLAANWYKEQKLV